MPREAMNHPFFTIAARETAQAGFCCKPAVISDAPREANRICQRNYWLKKQIIAEMERKWLAGAAHGRPGEREQQKETGEELNEEKEAQVRSEQVGSTARSQQQSTVLGSDTQKCIV